MIVLEKSVRPAVVQTVSHNIYHFQYYCLTVPAVPGVFIPAGADEVPITTEAQEAQDDIRVLQPQTTSQGRSISNQ
jgi:hypothetical protein